MKNAEYQEVKLIDQKIDYIKILKIFLSRWYWIAGCVIIAIILGYLKLWYTPEVYATTGSLKFEEKSQEFTSIIQSEINPFQKSTLQSEMFVISSRDVLLNAIGRLDYKVSYFLDGRVRTTDVYPKKPFPVEILHQDSTTFFLSPFIIKSIKGNEFKLIYKTGTSNFEKTYQYNNIVQLPGITFKVKKGNEPDGVQYTLKFNSKKEILDKITNNLSLKEAAKSSNVLQLTFTDKSPEFASDMLNAIMQEYIAYDIKKRGQSASQIIEFIEGQLKFLYDEVQESGKALEQYKRNNKFVNLSASTSVGISKLTEQQTKRNALQLEEVAIDQLEEQIKNNRDQVSINFNLEGTLGTLLTQLVTQLNAYLKERDEKLLQFNPNSASVELLDKRISETKNAIITNIRLSRERNKRTQRYVNNQITLAERDLNNIPSVERDFAKLQSDFDINQKVFDFLSEKRLESLILRAAVIPGAEIVDIAEGSYKISPIANKVYTNFILAGLGIGIAIILLIRVINPYIYDKETVESITNTPIIGVIRKFPDFIDQDNTQALSLQKPKSVFAESVRSVRTNLSYLAGDKASKVICITSEIAGEGKSFVSVNLASTLALIDKKVLLVGADLRRSKLHIAFQKNNSKGFSSYLSNQSDLASVIQKTSLEYLDFMPSGPVPPNPSELLHSDRMRDALEELRKIYDFILLDTAPVGLVSDSIPLIRNSDINLFVIRSGASKYSAASIPDRISNEYKLNNVVIVLNAFSDDPLHARYYTSNYTGGYGQYYYSDYSGYSGSGYYTDDNKAKKWWQIWKKS